MAPPKGRPKGSGVSRLVGLGFVFVLVLIGILISAAIYLSGALGGIIAVLSIFGVSALILWVIVGAIVGLPTAVLLIIAAILYFVITGRHYK